MAAERTDLLGPPVGEPTYAEPDQQDTLDALSPRARAARAARQEESGAGAPGEQPSGASTSPPPFDGMRIGRYQLLEMVGAGGMGMVWGAWDPQLERRVALKLVQPTMLEARERILAEGQALAKLSHPNVVPIYDVGVMGAQVYLVMEWVRGATLRAYARAAPGWRALLEAYRQAGEGLAAAHRAGIVHRDFKPDNVIHGDDGRTRVLDFGLALSGGGEALAGAAAGSPHPVAGTPRYMAPEQARGDAAVAATDQYAFAFSLHEALGELTARPGGKVPSWIAAILARGMAREPAQRFASMDELLAALARDPAKRWRRRAAIAAIAASAAGAFAVGRLRGHEAQVEPCAGSAAAIAAAWNDGKRGEVLAHLQGLGVLGADEPARLARDLDGYSAAWAAEHRGSCLARERRELTPLLYERRLACLARGQASLAAVAELLGSVPAEGLAAALIARRGLPDPDACSSVDDSAVMPPPPETAAAVAAVVPAIERARVLGVAQRPQALEAARASVAAAQATGHAPLIARALLVQGRAEVDPTTASATLAMAMALALQAFDDVLALEAYARMIWVAEYRDPPEAWLVMTQLAQRAGVRGRFGRALLFNNLGARHYRARQRDKARAMLQRALAETDLAAGKDPEDVELVAILRNLALIEPDAAQRQALMQRAATALGRALGPNHPSTLTAREQTAMLTRDPRQARPRLEEACLGYEPWKLAGPQAVCALELAWLADEQDDRAAALRWMRVAAADPKTAAGERIKGKIAAGYLALYEATSPASPSDARARLIASAHALRADGKAAMASPSWWVHVDASDAYAVAARTLEQLGRAAEAEASWKLALAALEGIDEPVYERRVARVRATVAARLALSQPAEAQRLAAAALRWYRLAGGYEAQIAQLEPLASQLR
jgi:eukaryotic-like serine/threonine-protein kinase